jgi:hypothetical protein
VELQGTDKALALHPMVEEVDKHNDHPYSIVAFIRV